MKIIDPDNQIQKDALLNEYKGNLFEYLFGLKLSKALDLESFYYENLNNSLKERLVLYEEFIRNHYFELLEKLIVLADKTTNEFIPELKLKLSAVYEIYLIGKNVATNDNTLWGETDLVVIGVDNNNKKKQLKISLKLSKEASYTNTKSAGVKSFIEKYFSAFSSAEIDQKEFNKQVDFYFQNFGAKLYAHEGLVFEGHFDQSWASLYPQLPGELNLEQQEILFEYYSQKASLMYEYLSKYLNEDKNKFINCLQPLVGKFEEDLIQIITFHKDHQFVKVKISKETISERLFESINYKKGSHFIDIKFKNIILQMRIKPMNKFTTQSYKVNCSVKEI